MEAEVVVGVGVSPNSFERTDGNGFARELLELFV